jgi:hypothetical protein
MLPLFLEKLESELSSNCCEWERYHTGRSKANCIDSARTAAIPQTQSHLPCQGKEALGGFEQYDANWNHIAQIDQA